MVKELDPEYQLFWMLVIDIINEFDIAEELVMVMDNTCVEVLKQETVTPEVELVHWKLVTREMVLGSVKKILSPE